MIVIFVVLFGVTIAARLAGAWSKNFLNSWPAALRVGLAAMFLFTGAAHFVPKVRDQMIAMVPPALPNPPFIVAFTGLCELLGAAGLLWPRTRVLAAWCLIVFLVAVFPANARAAREGMMVGGRPAMPLLPRGKIQLVLICLVWWSGVKRARTVPMLGR